MSKVTKVAYILIAALCIALCTVAMVTGLPSYAAIEAQAAAEQTITYHNYEYILHTLPFPMDGISSVDKYEETLSGVLEEGKQFKIFTVKIYELITINRREFLYELGSVPLKVTVMYDTGYCFYPRTADGTSVQWRNDTNWATYTAENSSLYSVMSTIYKNDEESYEDRTFWFEFQTLHKIEKFAFEVYDPFTNTSILTTKVSNDHVEIEECNYETGTDRDNYIPLFINSNDTELSFEDGYNMGFIDGEVQGQQNAATTTNGYQLGYDTGYQVGMEEGYKKGSYDVNLELENVTGVAIGSFGDLLMTLLNFEVAGISLWGILAIIGGIIIVGFLIKLAT